MTTLTQTDSQMPPVGQAPETLESLRAEVANYREWIARAAQVCRAAAQGDLERRLLRIPVGGDLGVMLCSINHLLDMTDGFVRESRAALDHAAEGKFFRRVLLTGMLGTFRQTAETINGATVRMANQAVRLACDAERRRELAQDLAEVVNSLASMATEMHATATSLSELAGRAKDDSRLAAGAASSTSDNVDTVAHTSEGMRDVFQLVQRQMQQCVASAQTAVQSAAEAGPVMEGLRQASVKIGGIVRLVSEVAQQTNLLALNATIEAARSGEAGKGFAVVAAEVKELARRTSRATSEITEEIQRSQTATQRMSAALTQICGRIDEISSISGEISGNVREQTLAVGEIHRYADSASTGARNVTTRIAAVSDSADQTSAWASQLVEAADALSRQSESLRLQMRRLLED